ncbi:Twin-arginine translocation protein TatA [Cronobacter condimenti 1330]|uniref:Sec-independent protein translocase protein TatA n=1 Tax=Cronobacter condimenti 1330 TaxID=1073999 RepID=K8A0P4_9ENTR|nr:Sec-independent protein translocase subunit TatA [Cronobacter condimenti]ALB61272.1 preprotein translocase subunit SecA [Cronobacter condimenti 1330]CCJ72380.1 Twin-arginine translocation protein TatA [Cronobacter condimenti 1330]
MGGISIWQLAIIVILVVLLFGTKKLRSLGSDLGESIKGFKKAMGDEDKKKQSQDADFTAPAEPDKRISETKSEVTPDDAKKRDKEQV